VKFLNLGCGGQREQGDEWVNLDDLHSQLCPGTPERMKLDSEPNYVNYEIGYGPLPFRPETFDGVLMSHVLEHFDAQMGMYVMRLCHEVLKPGGVLLVSVPNASYFRDVYPDDRNENWERLFEVSDPANPIPTFFEAALWFSQHKVILTEDALWCYFIRAGFQIPASVDAAVLGPMSALLNRRKFSIEMLGIKP